MICLTNLTGTGLNFGNRALATASFAAEFHLSSRWCVLFELFIADVILLPLLFLLQFLSVGSVLWVDMPILKT
jgi:hypothetical protein